MAAQQGVRIFVYMSILDLFQNGGTAVAVDAFHQSSQFFGAKCLPFYNIKLRTAGIFLRIHVIAFPGSSQCAPFVEIAGHDFGFQRVTRVAVAEECPCACQPRLRVARLNHEIFNDTVEQHAVVEAFAHQFQHVFPVAHRLVIQPQTDVSQRSFHSDYRPVLLLASTEQDADYK